MNLMKSVSIHRKVVLLVLLFSVFIPLSGEDEAIFQHIRQNNMEKAKEMLEKEPLLINTPNENGLTPLFFAVMAKNVEIAQMLIEKGAVVRIGDNNLRAPIHFANWFEDQKMIDLLLEHGAVIDTRAIGAATPLIHSSLGNDFKMSKYLIEKGADINIQCNSLTTPLYFAVLNNNLEFLNFLIDAGADIDVPDFLDRTPLFIAVRDGYAPLAEILYKNGADPFKKDKFLNRSMLHIAAIEGHNNIVEFLFNLGLKGTEKDSNGYTPLDYAYIYGHPSTAAILAKNGGTGNKTITPKAQTKNTLTTLKKDEAEIIKLQNGSWGIATQSVFFIFGYSEIGTEPTDKSLANGYLTAEEINQFKKVYYVDLGFHQKQSDTPFNGSNPTYSMSNLKNPISFILNPTFQKRYQPFQLKTAYFPRPSESLDLGDCRFTVYPSYKNNLCYVLEVDGLTILWLSGICDNYIPKQRETTVVDTLIEKGVKPDILLLGNPAGIGPELGNGIRETYLEAQRLNPKTCFAFGKEPSERRIARQIKAKMKHVKNFYYNFYYSGNPGDRFSLKSLIQHEHEVATK